MTTLPSRPMGFDFDEALKSLQAGQPLSGKGGILAPLIKQLTEAALAAELETDIDSEPSTNHKTVAPARPSNPHPVVSGWTRPEAASVVLNLNGSRSTRPI